MCCQVYVGICVISTLKYPQARHVLLLMVDINHAVLSQRLNIPK